MFILAFLLLIYEVHLSLLQPIFTCLGLPNISLFVFYDLFDAKLFNNLASLTTFIPIGSHQLNCNFCCI
ncbi:MAG: hypothetical protein MGG11_09385 [Trichodesmium sp. MAG_R03]|nr:hypothetical protein [Trichodesmium sp. MAG_R03]